MSRWLAYIFLCVVCFMAVACTSDSGTETLTLEIVSFAPDDGRTDVQREVQVGVRVNEPIDESTLSSETFFLVNSSGTVVSSVVEVFDEPDPESPQAGTAAVLTPNEPLDILTDYTVTVTTGLTSTSGKQLGEDFEWSFATLDSEWGEPEWIEPLGAGTSSEPHIGVDDDLNAIAVWQFDDDGTTRVYANRYTRRSLWGEPEPIDDAAGGSNVRLAVAGNGDAFVVWERTDGDERNIWTNRYGADTAAWEEPALLQTGEISLARAPSVAADPTGNAIAVWLQVDEITGRDVVRAARYESGVGWGDAMTIGTPEFATSATEVGIDDESRAIAIWNPLSGGVGGRIVQANRYTPAEGWLDPEDAEDVKPDDTTTAGGVRLDVSSNGDAFVIWEQSGEVEPRRDIWAAHFSQSTWSPPERVDDYDEGDKSTPDIAIDGAGVAHAVWSQSDPDFRNIWVAEYGNSGAWGAPTMIDTPTDDPDDNEDATAPRIDVNRVGNAVVVWRQEWDSWPSIWSNRRDPDSAWVGALLIEDFAGAANAPTIAVDEARHAHALWAHSSEGSRKMRTNRFE